MSKHFFVEDDIMAQNNINRTTRESDESIQIHYKNKHLLTIYGKNLQSVFVTNEDKIEIKK